MASSSREHAPLRAQAQSFRISFFLSRRGCHGVAQTRLSVAKISESLKLFKVPAQRSFFSDVYAFFEPGLCTLI